jgi:hypothetical protein
MEQILNYNSFKLSKHKPILKKNIGDFILYKGYKDKEIQKYKIIDIRHTQYNNLGEWDYILKRNNKTVIISQTDLFPEIEKGYNHPKFGFLGWINNTGNGYAISFIRYAGWSGNLFKTEKSAKDYLEQLYIESMRDAFYNLWRHHFSFTDSDIKTDNMPDKTKMVKLASEQFDRYHIPENEILKMANDLLEELKVNGGR